MSLQKFEMFAVGALALNSVSQVYPVDGNMAHTWQVTGTFTGTVDIQTSFDGGVTWASCAVDESFSAITAPGFAITPVSPLALVLIRWKLTAYSGGTLRVFYQGLPPPR
jgi:hypothetical protein